MIWYHPKSNYWKNMNEARKRAREKAHKLSSNREQEESPQAKGSSFKPESTSSRIREPGYKRTS